MYNIRSSAAKSRTVASQILVEDDCKGIIMSREGTLPWRPSPIVATRHGAQGAVHFGKSTGLSES